MKAIRFNAIGGPEVLELQELDIPNAKENEIIVQVKACGINRAELLYFQGQYLFQPEFPAKVGLEASGIIHAVGKNVEDYEVGQEVCLTPNVMPTEYGFIGEYVAAPIEAVIPKPENIGFEEAAAVWMSYATAYGGLVFRGGLQDNAGQIVLISAASSSVGLSAIQVAKNHGAIVIATTRTTDKKDYLLEQGADYAIATQEENLAERVMEITGGKGFDIAFDPVAGTFVNELAEAAANESTIVIYGILSLEDTPLPLFPLLIKGIRIEAVHLVFHILQHPERFAQTRDHILKGLAEGKYQPVIDRIFSLEEAKDAFSYMESNKQKGKILITINN